MKQRQTFQFLRSYYEIFKRLKTKKDQALFIETLLKSQFLCEKVEINPKFSTSLQIALEGISYQINSSIDGYTKHNGDLTPKQTPNLPPNPPPKKEKEKEKENIKVPKGIDLLAWSDFEQHRKEIRKPLTKLSRTKNQNILLDNLEDQREIIDLTIQNRWTGLFPLKKQTEFKGKQPQEGSLEWERQQMLKEQEETINAELM